MGTAPFETLRDGPTTEINRSRLNPEERVYVERLRAGPGNAHGRSGNGPGTQFRTVYYLSGEKTAAARKFAQVNQAAIRRLDHSQRNPLQSVVDDEVHRIILDELDIRPYRKYARTVVVETAAGTTWVFDRDRWEDYDVKYSSTAGGTAKLPTGLGLEALYGELPREFGVDELEDAGCTGSLTLLLDFYEDCGLYDCERVGRLLVAKDSG